MNAQKVEANALGISDVRSEGVHITGGIDAVGIIGLMERAARKGLVQKEQGVRDRRFVRVLLTPQGEAVLLKLSELHRDELARVRARLLTASRIRPRPIEQRPGA